MCYVQDYNPLAQKETSIVTSFYLFFTSFTWWKEEGKRLVVFPSLFFALIMFI
jgi:hypothetical protein